MPTLLAIDPGSEQSAWVLIDQASRRPLSFGLEPNLQVLERINESLFDNEPTYISWVPDVVAIEWVQSYGMAVGAEVFDTCRWVGRFQQAIDWTDIQLATRLQVKTHHCHSARATDANVRQALIDRFGGKGTKANPGWFYGFKRDLWAAYAVAVYVADELTALVADHA